MQYDAIQQLKDETSFFLYLLTHVVAMVTVLSLKRLHHSL